MNRFQPGAAERVLERWEADAGSLRHIATSGNAVYRFRAAGEDRILRLTDPAHRTPQHNLAEMRFLQHLARAGVPACAPVASRSGALVEEFEDGSACVLTWAPGERVEPGTPHWNAAFFREWGAHLARIHRAAIGYAGPARWGWREEGLIADAPALIPADDTVSREELELVLARLEALPRRHASYGMVHADFAPANFHYRPGAGITSFDFGNCCEHWFVSDLAISLSVLRRLPERDRYRDWILAGYREVLAPDPEAFEHLSWFLRLRIVYVYLSRLRAFGPEPGAEQREVLRALRAAVAERFEWN